MATPRDSRRDCPRCEQSKPLSEFYVRRGKPYGPCIPCKAETGREYRAKHRDRLNANRRAYGAAKGAEHWKDRKLRRLYGISLDDFKRLLVEQGGWAVCQVDGLPPEEWRVDHDHACCPGYKSCGRCVRGILCHSCNLLLGYAHDKTATLVAAINYLNSAEVRHVDAA